MRHGLKNEKKNKTWPDFQNAHLHMVPNFPVLFQYYFSLHVQFQPVIRNKPRVFALSASVRMPLHSPPPSSLLSSYCHSFNRSVSCLITIGSQRLGEQ